MQVALRDPNPDEPVNLMGRLGIGSAVIAFASCCVRCWEYRHVPGIYRLNKPSRPEKVRPQKHTQRRRLRWLLPASPCRVP